MDAKEYLGRVYRIDQQISSKIEQVSMLRSLVTKTTAALGTEPVSGTRNPHRMEEIIGRLMALEDEINSGVDCLIDTKREIMGIIGEIENPEHRTLLELRYLCYNPWAEIAGKMECGLRWVHVLHGRALADAEKIFSKKKQECT